MMLLARITISKQFKDWAIKYLHELHAKETKSRQEILQSQQQAYRGVPGQIEGLVKLKTSPGNEDGSLLSDGEYVERRGRLLKDKAALETGMQEIEHRSGAGS